MGEKKWTAREMKEAIAKRHREDLFFTEVKDGPTQIVNHHSKIDALAMKISWTNFSIIGYEVKVSRSDFLRDEKWRAYLPMCNQLYFAVAPGVCDVEEIPDVCGLVVMNSKGGIRTIKKAPWRDIEPPVEMFKYLMFTYIGALHRAEKNYPRHERLLPNERLELCKMYLEDKANMREIGRLVSRKLESEMYELRRKAERLDYIEKDEERADRVLSKICQALGVTSYYNKGERCLEAIEQMKRSGGLTQSMINEIQQINQLSGALLESVRETLFDNRKAQV